MLDDVQQAQLEEANKLIFVKQYEKAARLLDKLLSGCTSEKALLIHLRRIELASRLEGAAALRELYQEKIRQGLVEGKLGELCVAYAEQQGGLLPGEQLLEKFKALLECEGLRAAAYFGLALSYEQQAHYDRAIYNYTQSLQHDPFWFPSYFGLSQCFYRKQDSENGDRYFFMYEKFAPFNLYGNFETHKRLSDEFTKRQLYGEAEIALKMLVDWWVENEGLCPVEVQVYVQLSLGHIADKQNDPNLSRSYRQNAENLTMQALEAVGVREEVIYFIAKSWEEFSGLDMALKCYLLLLKSKNLNSDLIQKIGQHFLSSGNITFAQKFFDAAYLAYPEREEVRFYKLVSNLRKNNVAVEEYLLEKEQVIQFLEKGGDRKDALTLLYHLLARFDQDTDVHGLLGEVYQDLGVADKARYHYQFMYDRDGHNPLACLKFIAFLLANDDISQADAILSRLHFSEQTQLQHFCEFYWLSSLSSSKKGDMEAALRQLDVACQHDPWNVSYLVHKIQWMLKQAFPGQENMLDPALLTLAKTQDEPKDWQDFYYRTLVYEQAQQWKIVYARSKLYLLYQGTKEEAMRRYIKPAVQYNTALAYAELLRLVNTNYDSAWVYWGLGVLAKELWQLETAMMWFEYALAIKAFDTPIRNEIYIELADCYILVEKNLQKAVEYIKVVDDQRGAYTSKNLVILSHAYLRLGLVRQAQQCLEQIPQSENHFEAQYLRGLVHYRNGSVNEAKRLWKPLLTQKSHDIRTHHIKQDLLKYYYHGEAYLKAN